MTRRVAENKELAEVERIARDQGWEVKPSRSGHLKWRSPDGVMVTTSATPSDYYAIRNAKSDLKKAGLELPTRRQPSSTRQRKPRSRIPGLSTPGEVLLAKLNAAADFDPERELMLNRSRLILNMHESSDNEVRVAVKTLTKLQQDVLVDLLVADDLPLKTCPCGKEFSSFLHAGLHARKCDGKNSLAIEPESEVVSQEPDTIPTDMPEQPPTEQEIKVEPTMTTTQCATCDKSFDTPQARAGHERSHREIECSHCGKTFPENSIGQHRSHCVQNPDKNRIARKRKVECEHCGKAMQASSLTTHIKAFCRVAEHKRKNEAVATLAVESPAETALNGSAPLPTSSPVYDDEYFDTLLNIVIDNRPIAFSLGTVKVINQWIECTRTLLETLDRQP